MIWEVVIKYGYEVNTDKIEDAKLQAYREHIQELHQEGPVRGIIDAPQPVNLDKISVVIIGALGGGEIYELDEARYEEIKSKAGGIPVSEKVKEEGRLLGSFDTNISEELE